MAPLDDLLFSPPWWLLARANKTLPVPIPDPHGGLSTYPVMMISEKMWDPSVHVPPLIGHS